jgi:protein-disulfide isomerase
MLSIAYITSSVFIIVRMTGWAYVAARTRWTTWSQLAALRREMPYLRTVNRSMMLGSGPDSVVLFTDYECPYCVAQDRQMSSTSDWHSRLTVIVVHYPSVAHRAAVWGSRIAICASWNGDFERVHHALFEDGRWKDGGTFHAWASEAGYNDGDANQLQACAQSDSAMDAVAVQSRVARRLHVIATPTWMSQTRIVRGTQDMATLAR